MIPFCTNLGWHDVPFVEEMHKHLNLPVHVDNDATVAGYAESIAGVSAGTRASVFLTLGTGVGGGIVLGGRPYSGVHGIGSEIGHMILQMDGEPCTCGNEGCFERYASATAIIREARRAVKKDPQSMMMKNCGGNPERINAKIVIDCAKAGDKTARAVFDAYVRALAHGIISIINVLDPEIIVLGGGVSMAGDFLLNAVRDAGISGAALLGRKYGASACAVRAEKGVKLWPWRADRGGARPSGRECNRPMCRESAPVGSRWPWGYPVDQVHNLHRPAGSSAAPAPAVFASDRRLPSDRVFDGTYRSPLPYYLYRILQY